MSFSRRFLVAPSIVRLLNRDLGADPVIEGYFANQPGRSSYVRLAGENGTLVLLTEAKGVIDEERTDIPRAHAEALLDVASGRVAFARILLGRRDFEIYLDHFIEPRGLSLATVSCDDAEAIGRFRAPSWFGEEVTSESGYHNRQVALQGPPPLPDVPLSDGALHECLDMLETMSFPVEESRLEEPSDEDSETVDALRRFASAFSGPAASEEAPAVPATPAETPIPERPAKKNGAEPEDDAIRALAWSLRPQSSRRKDKTRR
jgi:CYTH domain-containing protein